MNSAKKSAMDEDASKWSLLVAFEFLLNLQLGECSTIGAVCSF